jgi:hypothetical protein
MVANAGANSKYARQIHTAAPPVFIWIATARTRPDYAQNEASDLTSLAGRE